MEDESAAALVAAPEPVVTEAPKGEETEGQTEGQAAEGQPEEERKSEAAKRREREKAAKARIIAERDEAQAKLRELEQRREKVLQAAKAQKEPTEADYPDPFDLQTARMLWGVEQKLVTRDVSLVDEAAEAVKSQVKTLQQQEDEIIQQSWAAQVEEAKTRYADFEKVAFYAPISDEVAKMVAKSDVAADVVYYLGQNHAIAREVSAMNPVDAARMIGRLEAEVTRNKPAPRTETKAPDPISPVRGSAGASLNPDKMSMQDYIAARRAGKIR